MPESILCRSVALKQFLHGPAYLEARCIAHCHNYTVVTSYLMYLMALMSCAAHVHAQSEADINSSATQAVPVCVAGSGERAAYTPSLSKLATTVIDLGAVHCAPGYVNDTWSAGYCNGSAYGQMDACTNWGACTAPCPWGLPWVTTVSPAVATCDGGDADFAFSGCGCTSGYYFDPTYEPPLTGAPSVDEPIPITQCRVCSHGTYSAGGATDCKVCSPGKYDDDANSGTPCVDCGAGNFTSNPLRCDGVCPAGTYAPKGSTNITDCGWCHPGMFDDDLNPATPCESCSPGNFTSDPLRCDGVCPIGTHAPRGSMVSKDCKPCNAGRYDDDADAASTCVPCPADTYQALSGTFECTMGPAGSVSSPGSHALENCCAPGTQMTAWWSAIGAWQPIEGLGQWE
jgi:hypothetical protein